MDQLLEGRRLVDLKVRELKFELRKRRLPNHGNKQELFQRLTEYLLMNPERGDNAEDKEQNFVKAPMTFVTCLDGIQGRLGAISSALEATNSDVTHVNNDVQQLKYKYQQLSLLVHSLMEEGKTKTSPSEVEVGPEHSHAEKKEALEGLSKKSNAENIGQEKFMLRDRDVPFRYRPGPIGSMFNEFHAKNKLAAIVWKANQTRNVDAIGAPCQISRTGLHSTMEKASNVNVLKILAPLRERETPAFAVPLHEKSYSGGRDDQRQNRDLQGLNAGSKDDEESREVVEAALILNAMRLRN